MFTFKKSQIAFSILSLTFILSSCTIVPDPDMEKGVAAPTQYPGSQTIGKAEITKNGNRFILENELISISYGEESQRLIALTVENKISEEKVEMNESAFALTFTDSSTPLKSIDMNLEGPIQMVDVLADPSATQAGKHYAGKALEATLISNDKNIRVKWRAELRNQASYLNVSIKIFALEKDIQLGKILLFHKDVVDSRMIGEVQGSVMASKSLYFAYEHPMADNSNGAKKYTINYSQSDVSDQDDFDKIFELDGKVQSTGDYKFEFRHHKGESKLNIYKVSLLEDGKVISTDKHHGWSDDKTDVNQFYTVSLDKYNKQSKYSLRVTLKTTNGTDSQGVIYLSTFPDGNLVTCNYTRNAKIPKGTSYSGSMVIGAYPKGLLRRAFLGYIEKERVHPYRTFLNYNSWYDIGYFNKYSETDALAVIKEFGEELVKKRGVVMDSLLFDDGWDNDETLWRFHAGFPSGFKNVSALAKEYGIRPGVWLSPWGGYGQPRINRVKAGRKNGFEIYENKEDPNASVFKMSGPKYYARFSSICKGMISSYGINQFKFDGIGGNSGNGADGYAEDFEAATKLIKELQKLEPEVYINLTTGTWPSPFWLKTCDSIWRGGFDHNFAGVGTKRQQWITYRDGMTYQNIVKKAPLFPISSLMVHGTILAEQAKGLESGSDLDFRDEIRTMFGAGGQLQEMYISPKLMNKQKWDDLAESAKWARKNAKILVDSHWIGGDPLKLEAYGFAAWKNNFGVLTLRNPSDKKQTISFTLQEAFELPKEAWSEFDFKCPYPVKMVDGKAVLPQRIYKFETKSFYKISATLDPFEVLVFETTPTQ